MLRVGAHMSVAGGVSLAIDRAVLHGCEALQIFAKNANRWRAAPLDPAEIRRTWEAGFSGHLVKPVTKDAVLAQIHRVLPAAPR